MYAHYHKSYKYSQMMTLVRKLRVHPCRKSLCVQLRLVVSLTIPVPTDSYCTYACVYSHVRCTTRHGVAG